MCMRAFATVKFSSHFCLILSQVNTDTTVSSRPNGISTSKQNKSCFDLRLSRISYCETQRRLLACIVLGTAGASVAKGVLALRCGSKTLSREFLCLLCLFLYLGFVCFVSYLSICFIHFIHFLLFLAQGVILSFHLYERGREKEREFDR